MATKLASGSVQELVPQNSGRKSIIFQNGDSTDSIFIKKERPGNNTVSSTDYDYKLTPGGFFGLSFQTDGEEAVKERWTFIASANTPRISFVESEEFKR